MPCGGKQMCVECISFFIKHLQVRFFNYFQSIVYIDVYYLVNIHSLLPCLCWRVEAYLGV